MEISDEDKEAIQTAAQALPGTMDTCGGEFQIMAAAAAYCGRAQGLDIPAAYHRGAYHPLVLAIIVAAVSISKPA